MPSRGYRSRTNAATDLSRPRAPSSLTPLCAPPTALAAALISLSGTSAPLHTLKMRRGDLPAESAPDLRSASRAPGAQEASPLACHRAREEGASVIPERARPSDAATGPREPDETSLSRRLPGRAVLDSIEPSASHHRVDRQAQHALGRERAGHRVRQAAQRAPQPAHRQGVGRPLSRAGSHDAERGPKRARLPPPELQEARLHDVWPRRRSALVCPLFSTAGHGPSRPTPTRHHFHAADQERGCSAEGGPVRAAACSHPESTRRDRHRQR